ncbi:MAG: outer membrane beta-barrel protein [Bacteroidales bacterium]|jgi:hypothetical protein|nr:outer membrane beta-barrel protein [Bacteroidales bacterium]
MKAINTLFIAAAATMLFSANVDAQNIKRSLTDIHASYNYFNLTIGDDENNNLEMHGAGAGFTESVSLSRVTPVYFDLGADFQYVFHQKKTNAVELTTSTKRYYSMYSVKVPVGLSYRYAEDDFGFSLFGGGVGMYHIGGEIKESKYDGTVLYKEDPFKRTTDAAWNRYQFGVQGGVRIYFGGFLISAAYEYYPTELATGLKQSQVVLGVGFSF